MTSEQTQRYRVFLRKFTTSKAAIRGFFRRLVLSRADALIKERTDSTGLGPGLRVIEERRIVAATAPPPTPGLWQDGRRGDEKGNSDQLYL
jgi:hypothetical protein